jgi:hypothetical protein
MGAIVDWAFYSAVYMGTEADEASFPALCARAGDIVGAMTCWAVTEDNIHNYPAMVQELYKKAICAQADFFAVNGLDSVTISAGVDNGFTVGKVSVHGRSGVAAAGKMSGSVAPLALMYLEQSGLLNPAVPVAPDMPMIGWWF